MELFRDFLDRKRLQARTELGRADELKPSELPMKPAPARRLNPAPSRSDCLAYTSLFQEVSATALRLRHQRMAMYSYALIWAGVAVGSQLGIFAVDTPHLWVFGTVYLINFTIYLVIYSGASRSLTDPSMTVLQMMVGVVFVTVILHYAVEIRGATHVVYFMVMTFGIFALDRYKMIMMSLFVMVCYTLLLLLEWWLWPRRQVFIISVGQWSILALGLAWFVYVGGYIYNLQQRFRAQRRVLRENEQHLTEANEQLQGALQRLAELAVRDELTGLFNRRYFLERLEEELAETERGLHALHIALIDLDHFKQVNDRYGHQMGDRVLRKLADVAGRELRRSDVVARYGGEEFIVLFSEGDTAQIRYVLERLRIAFADACRTEINQDIEVTLSAGLAAWQEGDHPDMLILRADKALYQAKEAGRNRLAVA